MIVIDLPMPPSANALWRSDHGRKPHPSIKYTDWINLADQLTMASRAIQQRPGGKPIDGPWEATVYLDRDRANADIDNLGTKAVFDWLQSREFVTNDKNCHVYSVRWTDAQYAPSGCRVILRAIEAKHG